MTANSIVVKHAKHILSSLSDWEEEAGRQAQSAQDTAVYDDIMVMEIGNALKEFLYELSKPADVTSEYAFNTKFWSRGRESA